MPFFVITSRNLCWTMYWITLPFSTLPPAWFPSLGKIKIQLELQQSSGLYARWPVTRTFGEKWNGHEFSGWDHNADLNGWESLSCVLTYSINRSILNLLAGLKNTLWLSDTFRKTNISVEKFHCKKEKEKPLIKEQKQNKSNACLYGDLAQPYSHPHTG